VLEVASDPSGCPTVRHRCPLAFEPIDVRESTATVPDDEWMKLIEHDRVITEWAPARRWRIRLVRPDWSTSPSARSGPMDHVTRLGRDVADTALAADEHWRRMPGRPRSAMVRGLT
jgi:hypothetical protein